MTQNDAGTDKQQKMAELKQLAMGNYSIGRTNNFFFAVGDLKAYGRVGQHYVAHRPVAKNLFTVDGRPDTVSRLYDAAVASPLHVIRQVDHYRSDGRRASKVFLCLPFFKDTRVSFDLDIEMRRPASLSTARDWLSDDETIVGNGPCDDPKVLVLNPVSPLLSKARDANSSQDAAAVNGASSSTAEDDENVEAVLRKLPSPEEMTYVMSLKFPYSDVPIDVTGSGFRRMASLRRSFLQHVEYLTKGSKSKRHHRNKSKRRTTISGTTDLADLDEASNRRRHQHLQKLVSSSCGTQTSPERTCLSDGEQRSSRRNTTVEVYNVVEPSAASKLESNRSASSLRKKLKSKLLMQEASKETMSSTSSAASTSSSSASSSSLPGLKWFQRKSRSRNSIIGSLGIYEELERVKKSRVKGFFGMGNRGKSSLILECDSPSKSSADTDSAAEVPVVTHRNKGGGGGGSSNKQASIRSSYRSSLPVWIASTSRGALTSTASSTTNNNGSSSSNNNNAGSAVKLRENPKKGRGGGVEDGGGQSSSGNWSASSSTRTSVGSTEGDRVAVIRTRSQASLSKDSALSDRATPDHRWTDVGCHNGYNSDVSVGTSSSLSNNNRPLFRRSVANDTVRWLRSLEEERAALGFKTIGVGETSSSGTVTPRSQRRGARGASSSPIAVVDDGESSEFSVDTDGYYTSMHTDSGLRPLVLSSITAAATTTSTTSTSLARRLDDASTLSKLSDLQECGSSTTIGSMGSSEEVDDDNDGGGTLKRVIQVPKSAAPEATEIVKKKVPPPPPPRRSTLSTSNTTSPNRNVKDKVHGAPAGGQVCLLLRPLDFSSSSSATSSSSSDSADQRPRKCSTSSAESELGPCNEKLKLKTSIDAGRIPSMCVVTPSPSDEEDDEAEGKVEQGDKDQGRASKAWSADANESYVCGSLPGTLPIKSSFAPRPQSNGNDISSKSLPRAFSRSVSFNSHVSCEEQRTWPRTPPSSNQMLYRPETITVTSRSRDQLTAASTLASFSRPPEQVRRPNSIAVSSSHPPPPPNIVSPTGNHSTARSGGARVTLDPTGHVIASTSDSVSRTSAFTSGGGSSVRGSNGPAPVVPASPIVPIMNSFAAAPTAPNVNSPSANCNVSGAQVVGRQEVTARTPDRLSTSSQHGSSPPRRWNSFFQRRDPNAVAAPSPGAYIRLDGHPEHLEPAGTPASSSSSSRDHPPASKASSIVRGPLIVTSTPVAPKTSELFPPYWRRQPVETTSVNNGASSRIPVQSSSSHHLRTPASPLPPYYTPVLRKPGQPVSQAYARPCNGVAGKGPHSLNTADSLLQQRPQLSTPTQPMSAELANGNKKTNNNIGPTMSPFGASQAVHPSALAVATSIAEFQQPENTSPAQQMGLRARIPTGDPNCSGLPEMHPNSARPNTALPRNAPQNAPQAPGSAAPAVAQQPSPAIDQVATTTNVLPSSPQQSPSKTPAAKSTMSNEDLYALIHRSKRRMNIRTDAERAISPPCPSPSPASGQKINFDSSLSTPRSRSPLCHPGDRRSWAGVGRGNLTSSASSSPAAAAASSSTTAATPSSLSNVPAGDRHSWASDRLGPAKHTSLHDFKLLLLQAGRSVPKEVANARPSATELLMSPPPSPIKVASAGACRTPPSPLALGNGFSSPQQRQPQRFATGLSNGMNKRHVGGPSRHGHHRNLMVAIRGCSSPSSAALMHGRSDVLSTPIFEDEDEGPIANTSVGRIGHGEVITAV